MEIFMIYYFISVFLTLLWYWYSIECSDDEEILGMIADVTWDTGIKRENVKLFLYTIALLFGWLILPYEIVSRLIGKGN